MADDDIACPLLHQHPEGGERIAGLAVERLGKGQVRPQHDVVRRPVDGRGEQRHRAVVIAPRIARDGLRGQGPRPAARLRRHREGGLGVRMAAHLQERPAPSVMRPPVGARAAGRACKNRFRKLRAAEREQTCADAVERLGIAAAGRIGVAVERKRRRRPARLQHACGRGKQLIRPRRRRTGRPAEGEGEGERGRSRPPPPRPCAPAVRRHPGPVPLRHHLAPAHLPSPRAPA